MLKAYKDKKNKLLNQYDEILKLPNILSEDIRIEDIKEKKQQLEEEHFFVSFTGQIKSGKSTLINALIFGEEVIPADDIPHTAKITIIKYGEKPYLEATFYNKEEWKILQSNQEFYKEFLEADIEESIGNGVFLEELINTKAKSQKEENLENLKEYVARGGKYTPFVNFVTLYYPNEILKEVTIVDTPGTNDPNKLRDKVAKEWIYKTNANIYITYANQAMDSVDIDFIDNFLLSIPKEQKLTVINKIDSVNDTDGLEEYISELLEDESLRRREIVSDRESLVLVSGLGALIDKMLITELPLNENLNYYAEQLDEKGFLEPENHKLPTLEKMIEQKLIENKGKNIIESHSQFLDLIFEKRIIELKKRLEVETSRVSDLFKSNEELKEKRKALDEIIIFIVEKQKSIRNNFDNLVQSKLEDFYSLSIKQNKVSIENIEKELNKINNISIYKKDVLWIVKNSIDSNFDTLKKEIKSITDDLTDKIEKDIDALKYKIVKKDENVSINFTSESFSIYTLELVSTMKELAETDFKKNKIKKLVKENSKFFQLKKTNIRDINEAIMSETKSFFDKTSSNTKEKFEAMLKQHIQENILEKTLEELSKIMNSKKEEIESSLKHEEDKKDLIKKVTEEKISLEKELKSIKKYQEEMME